jgi:hypothetical protein
VLTFDATKLTVTATSTTETGDNATVAFTGRFSHRLSTVHIWEDEEPSSWIVTLARSAGGAWKLSDIDQTRATDAGDR